MEYLVETSDAGRTVENLLRRSLGFSLTMVRKLKRNSGVTINGSTVSLNHKLKPGDVININLKPTAEATIIPQPIDIEIVYEDEQLLVVNKPPQMLIHPLKHEPYNTLANAVLYHYQQSNQDLCFKPVSRLDRDTSGLVVIAKDSHTAHRLAQQLHTSNFIREYTAIVHGQVRQPKGVIVLPIARYPESKIKQMVDMEGRYAATHYQVERYIKGNTLVKLQLETGRTHQIRVHLSFIGFPLVGDDLYGGLRDIINRQALHCHSVMLTQPWSGEPLVLKATLPEDMLRLTR